MTASMPKQGTFNSTKAAQAKTSTSSTNKQTGSTKTSYQSSASGSNGERRSNNEYRKQQEKKNQTYTSQAQQETKPEEKQAQKQTIYSKPEEKKAELQEKRQQKFYSAEKEDEWDRVARTQREHRANAENYDDQIEQLRQEGQTKSQIWVDGIYMGEDKQTADTYSKRIAELQKKADAEWKAAGGRDQTIKDRAVNVLTGAGQGWVGPKAKFYGSALEDAALLGEKLGSNTSDYAGWATDEMTAAQIGEENDPQKRAQQIAETRQMQEFGRQWNEQGSEKIEKAKEGLGFLGRLGIDLGANYTQTMLDKIPAMLMPGGGMLSLYTRSAGGGMLEAEAEGASRGQAKAYGMTVGAIEAATEKMFGAFAKVYGKGSADDIVESVVRKLAKTRQGRQLLLLGADIGGEAIEEVVSDIANPYASAIYDKGAALKKKFGSWDGFKEAVSEELYDGLIGGLMGGLGGATKVRTGDYSRTATKMELQDAIDEINAQEQAPVNPGARNLQIFLSPALDETGTPTGDQDVIALTGVKGNAKAYLNARLNGETGGPVLGDVLNPDLVARMPEGARQAALAFGSTEGAEQATQNVLNYISDIVLGNENGKPLQWDDAQSDAATGYVLATLATKFQGGLEVAPKNQMNIAREAIEFAQKGMALEEAIDIANETAQKEVTAKPAPVQTVEPEQDSTGTAWTGDWDSWVEAALSGGALSDTDINTIYSRPEARRAFEERKGSLEGLSEEEAKSRIGMAAGTMTKVVAQDQAQETPTEASGSEEAPEGINSQPEAENAEKGGYNSPDSKAEEIPDTPRAKVGSGTVSFDGATLEGKEYAAVNMGSLTTTQKNQIKALETLAKTTGVNITFFQSKMDSEGRFLGANGAYKDGTLYLDVNAGLNKIRADGTTAGEIAVVRTAAHELTHFIQDFNETDYNDMKAYIVDALVKETGTKGLDELIDLKIERAKRGGGNISRAQALDEVIADGCEMMLKNSKVVEELAAENMTLARRIGRWIRSWNRKLKAAFEGVDAHNKEAKILMKEADKLQKMWDAALKKAVESSKKVNIDNAANLLYNVASEVNSNDRQGSLKEAGRGVSGRESNLGAFSERDASERGSRLDGGVLLSDKAKAAIKGRGKTVVDLSLTTDRAAFSAALDAARESNTKNGWAVSPKSTEELSKEGTKVFMNDAGNAGLVVTADGDIEAVFANHEAGAPSGASLSLLPVAIANGGVKLDCYGPTLARIYSQYGFVPVAVVEFNKRYADPLWDESKGRQPVYVMMHNGDSADTVAEKAGKYPRITSEQLASLPKFGKNDYFKALEYRDRLLEESKSEKRSLDRKARVDGAAVLADRTREFLLKNGITEEELEDFGPVDFSMDPNQNISDVDNVMQMVSDVASESATSKRGEAYLLMEGLLDRMDPARAEAYIKEEGAKNQAFANWYNKRHPSLYYKGYAPGDLFWSRFSNSTERKEALRNLETERQHLQKLLGGKNLAPEDRVSAESFLHEVEEAQNGGVALYSDRDMQEPKNTQYGFKLMNVDENGLPHAMFIDAAKPYELGKWYAAEAPGLDALMAVEPGYAYLVDADDNVDIESRRPITRSGSGFKGLPGKNLVDSATLEGKRWMTVYKNKAGETSVANVGINGSGGVSTFAMRPGIHAVDIPSMAHIGAKSTKGKGSKIDTRRPNQRWFLIEYPVDNDYNLEAFKNKRKDIRDHLPTNGWYSFQTNSGAEARQHWFITGGMKIVGAVSENDIRKYAADRGFEEDLPWKLGKSYNDDDALDLDNYMKTTTAKPTPSKSEMFDRIVKERNEARKAGKGPQYSDREDYDAAVDEAHNIWAPEFYSKMDQTIQKQMPNKMAANQVIPWLNGKGIKKEEIRWSGIEQFLEGKKSVAKDEIRAFMEGNKLDIETKTLKSGRGPGDTWTAAYYEDLDFDDIRDAEELAWEMASDYDELDPDQLTGWYGEEDGETDSSYIFAAPDKETGELVEVLRLVPKEVDTEGDTNWSEYKIEGGENYREILFKLPELDYTNTSSRIHWKHEAEGTIAHARVQDMKTPYGRKVLFVEEIQSDLHNAGAKSGFLSKDGYEFFNLMNKGRVNRSEEEESRYDELSYKLMPSLKKYNEAKEAVASRQHDIDRLTESLYARLRYHDYPENSNEYYVAYGTLKSEVRKWVAHGVDNIDGSHERYLDKMLSDLLTDEEAKSIEEYRELIEKRDAAEKPWHDEYRKLVDASTPDVPFAGSADTYHEYVMKHLLRLAAEGNYDYIGWTTADQQSDRWSDEYEEGYRIEYDQNLPKFMNKYAKQWGVKTGRIDITTRGDDFNYSRYRSGLENVWGVEINDKMKSDVLYVGQPMFQERDLEEEYEPQQPKTPAPETPKGQQPSYKPSETAAILAEASKTKSRAPRKVLSEGTGKVKISQFYSNTLEKTGVANIVNKSGGKYNVKSEAESLANAATRLKNDYKGMIKYLVNAEAWSGEMADAAYIVEEELLKDFARTGDRTALDKWERIQSAKRRESARAVQATAKMSRPGAAVVIRGIAQELEAARAANEEAKKAGKTENIIPEEVLQRAETKANEIANKMLNIEIEIDDRIDAGMGEAEAKEKSKEAYLDLIDEINAFRHVGLIQDAGVNAEIRNNVKDLNTKFRERLAEEGMEYIQRFAACDAAGITEDIHYKGKKDFLKRLNTWQKLAQLTGTGTWGRNGVGNGSFGLVDVIANNSIFTRLADAIISKKTGKRSTGFEWGVIDDSARDAARHALNRSILEVAANIDLADNGQTKYDMSRNRTYDPDGKALERMVSRWEQWNGYMLQSSDAWFKGMAEGSAAQAIRGANNWGEDNLTDTERSRLTEEEAKKLTKERQKELDETTKQIAEYRTFQNDGWAADKANKLRDALNKAGHAPIKYFTGKDWQQGQFGLGTALMPYTKVPTNLGVKSLEFSPLGAAKGLAEMIKVMTDPKATMAQQNKAVTDFGRGMTGTALIAILAALMKNAKWFKDWEAEEDKDVKAQNKAEGKSGIQVNWSMLLRHINGDKDPTWQNGDNVVDISSMEPVNQLFTTASLIAEGMTARQALFTSAKDNLMGIPALQQLQNIENNIKYTDTPEDGWQTLLTTAASTAGSVAGGMLPAPLRHAGTAADPYARDTSGKNALERAWNQTISSVPVARTTLPVKTDAFGNEVKAGGVGTRIANQYLPFKHNQVNQSAASREIERLREATGETLVPSRTGPKTVQYGKTKVELDPEERNKYKNESGQEYQKAINSLMKSPVYNLADDDTKAAMVAELESYAKDTAKEDLAKKNNIKYESKYNEFDDLDKPAVVIGTKAGFNDAKNNEDWKAMDNVLKAVSNGGVSESDREFLEDEVQTFWKMLDMYEQGVSSKKVHQFDQDVKAIYTAEHRSDSNGSDLLAAAAKGVREGKLTLKEADALMGRENRRNEKNIYEQLDYEMKKVGKSDEQVQQVWDMLQQFDEGDVSKSKIVSTAISGVPKREQQRIKNVITSWTKTRATAGKGRTSVYNAMRNASPDYTPEDVQKFWYIVDANGDGTLTKKEFNSALKKIPSEYRSEVKRNVYRDMGWK